MRRRRRGNDVHWHILLLLLLLLLLDEHHELVGVCGQVALVDGGQAHALAQRHVQVATGASSWHSQHVVVVGGKIGVGDVVELVVAFGAQHLRVDDGEAERRIGERELTHVGEARALMLMLLRLVTANRHDTSKRLLFDVQHVEALSCDVGEDEVAGAGIEAALEQWQRARRRGRVEKTEHVDAHRLQARPVLALPQLDLAIVVAGGDYVAPEAAGRARLLVVVEEVERVDGARLVRIPLLQAVHRLEVAQPEALLLVLLLLLLKRCVI